MTIIIIINKKWKKGYQFDSMLSNKNEKVYYNPTDNKLLVSVAGTDKFSPKDIITDAYLASGKLQNTSRYQHAHNTIIDAKKRDIVWEEVLFLMLVQKMIKYIL